ncbi:MAG TPA: threonine synthase [Candidatus Fimenecus excrementigallinarum]|uniref:Threonine synthase n=1 Tax=Candidatus Fimenecus excrementigallinarum TaxID=2840816 RepID=A0A9D1II02_9FIRM|nr:threonine synthase [Candidatus Fimenecus excrementigallinarum]
MIYTSTRDASVRVSASEAIAKGISADGGLFVPMTIPTINLVDIERLMRLDYIGRAKEILKLYLTDFSDDELAACVENAYRADKFSSPEIAPLYALSDEVQVLELWRGPTCAFKDMALQLLPHLLTAAAAKTRKGVKIVILVATSGDTGKAALEGFCDVPNTQILVFYPENGVSPMQKLQMTTQAGANVGVCAIEGNFDDAQTGVKAIFTDRALEEKFAAHNLAFSSANSINWGRLVPQIVYYVSAYCDMVKSERVKLGAPVNVVVPTGNFGNILAAYYAKQMGVPIGKLICASNANDVLTEFLTTGVYNRKRPFYCTESPSMDILVSSNLERLLFLLSGQDADQTRAYMQALTEEGSYKVSDKLFSKLSDLFAAGSCDDADTERTIRRIFEEYHYLCDTHTAVALNVYAAYRTKTGDAAPTVVASTANPYKFSKSVLHAISPDRVTDDEFDAVEALHELTGAPVPPQLGALRGKTPRFTKVVSKEDMTAAVLEMLGL